MKCTLSDSGHENIELQIQKLEATAAHIKDEEQRYQDIIRLTESRNNTKDCSDLSGKKYTSSGWLESQNDIQTANIKATENPYSPKYLIEQAKDILRTEYHPPEPGIITQYNISGPKYNKWINDLYIMKSQISDNCPLKAKLNDEKLYKTPSVANINKIIGILESLIEWQATYGGAPVLKNKKEYDVFLSHVNADKLNYVDELYNTLKILGIKIFYDSAEIDWGDNWKTKILNGTASSEFAIIVISEKFFGREWTERELKEFFARQNESGQKIVLPLLYNTTIETMKTYYPFLAEIQAINADKFSKEQIALLFAKELIKRLKGVN